METLMSPDTLARTLRWSRRKRASARYCQRGYIAGNVRYSGKGGTGGRPDTRDHKRRQAA